MKFRTRKIILYSLIGCILLIGAYFLGRHLYIKHLSNQPVVFNNVKYKNIEEVPTEDLVEYLRKIAFIFEEKTIKKFSYDDIAIVTAYTLLVKYSDKETATEQEVKDFVEMFFGISDYDLKPGTYILKEYDMDRKIEITKNGDTYSSNVGGYGADGTRNKFVSKKVVDNKIIMTYDFGYHGDMSPSDTHVEIIGKNEIYLESNGKTLFVKKIVYTPVK